MNPPFSKGGRGDYKDFRHERTFGNRYNAAGGTLEGVARQAEFFVRILQEMIDSLKARAAAITSAAAVTALMTAGCRAPMATTRAMLP